MVCHCHSHQTGALEYDICISVIEIYLIFPHCDTKYLGSGHYDPIFCFPNPDWCILAGVMVKPKVCELLNRHFFKSECLPSRLLVLILLYHSLKLSASLYFNLREKDGNNFSFLF